MTKVVKMTDADNKLERIGKENAEPAVEQFIEIGLMTSDEAKDKFYSDGRECAAGLGVKPDHATAILDRLWKRVLDHVAEFKASDITDQALTG